MPKEKTPENTYDDLITKGAYEEITPDKEGMKGQSSSLSKIMNSQKHKESEQCELEGNLQDTLRCLVASLQPIDASQKHNIDMKKDCSLLSR